VPVPVPVPTPAPTPSPALCTQFDTETGGSGSSAASCSNGTSASRRRHNGLSTYPEIGDTIYTTGTCTTTFNGGSDWYFVGGDLSTIQINSSGVVIDKDYC